LQPFGPDRAARRASAPLPVPSASSSAAPSASPVQPTVTPPPVPQQATTPPIVAQACPSATGGSRAAATITDVRVGAHAGFDSLVVEFSGGIPAYQLTS